MNKYVIIVQIFRDTNKGPKNASKDPTPAKFE